MKGILLAGGHGERLKPITLGVSKHLLPVYDKPMIYYSLSLLMQAGIKDICIITVLGDHDIFFKLLGDGSQWGIQIQYAEQEEPAGIAQVFHILAEWIGDGPCCLALGDNLFYGHSLNVRLQNLAKLNHGAAVLIHRVADPNRYGVVEFDTSGSPLRIVEKPESPPSHWAVTGLYFYDRHAVEFAHGLQKSARGEYEITDLNQIYLDRRELVVEKLGRGYAWFDMGTPSALLEASGFVEAIQERQGLLIGSPDEWTFRDDSPNS